MKSAQLILFALISSISSVSAARAASFKRHLVRRATPITPKVFIISLFEPEAAVWHGIPDFDLLAQNITVPGFSPILQDAHCTADESICQVVTGEGEINAASTINALVTSSLFNLSSTYFLIAGIAGINPACGTLGGVSFAKYAVQVGLEYEIDTRELESNYTSGYFALGTKANDQYPVFIYGTEVFELNAALRDKAMGLASNATLMDSPGAQAYRAKYPNAPANAAPSVFAGDVTTSDVFWHGQMLGQSFENYVSLLTNGSGKYCMTAQEDNGILESMLRGALFDLVDFSRIMLMRTAANFDRPPPGISASQELFYIDQGGFVISTLNLYNAGRYVVNDIVAKWDSTYAAGINATNYVGDIFDSLKGPIAADIGSPFYQTG